MKHHFILITLSCLYWNLGAQVIDDFSDGNFSANPTWIGDDSLLTVNASLQLQSKGTVAKDLSLAVASHWSNDCEWRFWIRNAFSPSGQNFCRVYLMSDSSNLKAGLNGYYIQLGGVTGNTDSITLYKQKGNVRTRIIAGRSSTVSKSNNLVKLRVLRDAIGNWELYSDTSGSTNFILEGTGTDNEFTQSAFAGFFFRYTSGNAANFYADDVYFGPKISDNSPPEVDQITVLDNQTVRVTFNENIDIVTALENTHYTINQGIGNPIQVTAISTHTVELKLFFTLQNKTQYALTVEGVLDQSGNEQPGANYPFNFFRSEPLDVLISEFLPDPSPRIALPENEFIELYNNSSFPIQLAGWTFSDASGSASLPAFTLQPDSFVILCATSNVTLFQSYGSTIGLSNFPSLNNSSDDIRIRNEWGTEIHRIAYDLSWYNDASKTDGGWSIELINPKDMCKGKLNYQASSSTAGGTPGIINSNWINVSDNIKPGIVSLSSSTINAITIDWSEPMDSLSLLNCSVNLSPVAPILNRSVDADKRKLTLTTETLTANQVYQIAITGARDCNQNSMDAYTNSFSYFLPDTAKQYDVLITEIMANPEPVVNLPAAEYIELHNRSARVISLHNWTLSDNTTTVLLPAIILRPDSSIVLTALNNAPFFNGIASAYGINRFPTLSNDSERLVLRNATGHVIHAVEYSSSWYNDNVKANGGWSLEMLDYQNPCGTGENWTASANASGGTPGKLNAIKRIVRDRKTPALVQAYTETNHVLRLTFDETMDSTQLIQPSNFSLSPARNIVSIKPVQPFYNEVLLTIADSFAAQTIYRIVVSNVYDCAQNKIETHDYADFGIAETLDKGDVVINEILFDPRNTGVDFVELYNRSQKIIDLKNVFLANTTDQNEINSFSPVAERGYTLLPGHYVVATSSPELVRKEYYTPNPFMMTVCKLPTYANDKGTCALIDLTGTRYDEFTYSDKMHIEWLDIKDGVSLERIDYNRPTNDNTNWTSASSTSGFATPAYRNSQYSGTGTNGSELQIEPEVFSPNNDGWKDIVTFTYNLEKSGYTGSITIYDSNGREVKKLLRNGILGTTGSISWDGATEELTRASVGIYIVSFEYHSLSGEVKRIRKTVVLGGKIE